MKQKILKFLHISAPYFYGIGFVVSLTYGCVSVYNLTSAQNQCVQEKIEAGVPKTNPVQMGCV